MKRILLATAAIAGLSLDCLAQEPVIQLHVQPMAGPGARPQVSALAAAR